MTLRRYHRPILIIMTLMMAWVSLWTPTCLAMGVGKSSMQGMTCDCPFAGQMGGMSAGCAKVENLSTYVHANPIIADIHVFDALSPAPCDLLPDVRRVSTVVPAIGRPPPRKPRQLNIEHCVFLI